MTKKLRRSLSDEIKSATIYLHTGFVTLIVLCLVGYIFAFATSSQYGNRVQQVQQQMQDLQVMQDRLAIEALDAQTVELQEAENLSGRVSVKPAYLDSRLNRLTRAD